MTSYEHGKIYKMLMPDGYFYIGCTCNELKARKQNHKDDRNKPSKIYTHIRSNNIEWNDINMVLYEAYSCKTRSELLLRESQIIREHFDNKFCLNTLKNSSADGSIQKADKERKKNYSESEEGKEHLRNYLAIYKEKNKIELSKKNKIYYLSNIESVKDYRSKNKEKIKLQYSIKTVCCCGSSVSQYRIKRHEQTEKHLKWISENPP